MSTCVDDLVVVSQAIYDLLNGRRSELGNADVWYGDQKKLPRTPAICIEPGEKERELGGAPRQNNVLMTVYVMVYSTQVQDVQLNRLDADVIAEKAEDILHEDAQLGGLVVHSITTRMESGYTVRGAGLVRACRLTFTMLSKTLLPYTSRS